MDDLQRQVLMDAESMRIFSDEEHQIIIGEWRAWRSQCYREGRIVPPAEWKAEHRKDAQ